MGETEGGTGEGRSVLGENASYGCTTIFLYFSLGSPMMRI